MKATDIREGKLYAASTYGRPEVSTRIRQVRVLGKIQTRGSKQTQWEVRMTGSLNRDWSLREYEDGRTMHLKSGNIYMPWPEFEQKIEDRRERQRKYQEERDREQKEAEKKQEEKKDLIREVAKLTGVKLLDVDSGRWQVKTSLRGDELTVKWEVVRSLLESLKTQQGLVKEATQDAMDILGDVF